MKTSPSTPLDLPFSISSVLASFHPSQPSFRNQVDNTHLQVHVPVGRDKVALVLETPLETNIDRLAGELLQKRLGIHGLRDGDQLALVLCHATYSYCRHFK